VYRTYAIGFIGCEHAMLLRSREKIKCEHVNLLLHRGRNFADERPAATRLRQELIRSAI